MSDAAFGIITPVWSYAETYSMRSRFYQIVGAAGKLLAEAYQQADAENQAAIRQIIFQAMAHSLIEHHGYRAEEIKQ